MFVLAADLSAAFTIMSHHQEDAIDGISLLIDKLTENCVITNIMHESIHIILVLHVTKRICSVVKSLICVHAGKTDNIFQGPI